MLRPLTALACLFALAGCGELDTTALGGDPLGPGRDMPAVELPTCEQTGVPVITGVEVDWDDVHHDWIAVELRGLTCGADVEGFRFVIFDGDERNITGRAWPEVDSVEVGEDDTFVVRGDAAGCGSFQAAARIELTAQGVFGTRCATPVMSAPVSADIRPFEWPAE